MRNVANPKPDSGHFLLRQQSDESRFSGRERLDHWMALKTKPFQDCNVQLDLESRKIPYIYPARRSQDGRLIPLFQGYIFVKPAFSDLHALQFIRGSRGLVRTGNRPGIVSEREISAIQILISKSVSHEILHVLHKGQLVLVKEGPLAGLVGNFVSIKGSQRVVINIKLLRQSILVEVGSASVESVTADQADLAGTTKSSRIQKAGLYLG